jgi:hypothetical protein
MMLSGIAPAWSCLCVSVWLPHALLKVAFLWPDQLLQLSTNLKVRAAVGHHWAFDEYHRLPRSTSR